MTGIAAGANSVADLAAVQIETIQQQCNEEGRN